jgi:hypothetical protein
MLRFGPREQGPGVSPRAETDPGVAKPTPEALSQSSDGPHVGVVLAVVVDAGLISEGQLHWHYAPEAGPDPAHYHLSYRLDGHTAETRVPVSLLDQQPRLTDQWDLIAIAVTGLISEARRAAGRGS